MSHISQCKPLGYGPGERTLQIDAIVYNNDTGILRAYEIKRGSVDSSVKCNGLSKSDFDVFSKVGQHCLEWGFITEAFAWSEIGGEDDVLQLLLIEGIDVQVAGQPTAQSTRWRSRCRPFGRTHRHHRTTSSC